MKDYPVKNKRPAKITENFITACRMLNSKHCSFSKAATLAGLSINTFKKYYELYGMSNESLNELANELGFTPAQSIDAAEEKDPVIQAARKVYGDAPIDNAHTAATIVSEMAGAATRAEFKRKLAAVEEAKTKAEKQNITVPVKMEKIEELIDAAPEDVETIKEAIGAPCIPVPEELPELVDDVVSHEAEDDMAPYSDCNDMYKEATAEMNQETNMISEDQVDSIFKALDVLGESIPALEAELEEKRAELDSLKRWIAKTEKFIRLVKFNKNSD